MHIRDYNISSGGKAFLETKTMKKDGYISVYLRNAEGDPASFYRVVQYLKTIKDINFKVNNALTNKEYQINISLNNGTKKKSYQLYLFFKICFRRLAALIFDLIHNPSLIIVSREVCPRYITGCLTVLLYMLCKRKIVIWDFDDDIFAFGEISKRESDILKVYSRKIIVTHDYLRELLGKDSFCKAELLPTTDGSCSRKRYILSTIKREEVFLNELRIVWVGTSNNLENLDIAIEGIEKCALYLANEIKKKVRFIIVCNKPYEYKSTPYLMINNIKWTRKKALQAMLNSHIGIMPLKESNYSKGKGGFKLIQYLSCGLPIIASPEGFNNSIVDDSCGRFAQSDEDWFNSLLELSRSADDLRTFSKQARKRYEDQFSFEHNVEYWKRLIKDEMRL